MITYGSDDSPNRSPVLQPIIYRRTSPPHTSSSAPPPRQSPPSNPEITLKGLNRRRKRKPKPSQGDVVLLGYLDPNRPDIAQAAGQRALYSGSEPDSVEDSEEENTMGVESPIVPGRAPHEMHMHMNGHTNRSSLSPAPFDRSNNTGSWSHASLPNLPAVQNIRSHSPSLDPFMRRSRSGTPERNDSFQRQRPRYSRSPEMQPRPRSSRGHSMLNESNKRPLEIDQDSAASSPDMERRLHSSHRSPRQKLATFHADSSLEHGSSIPPPRDEHSLPSFRQLIQDVNSPQTSSVPETRPRTSSYSSISSTAGESTPRLGQRVCDKCSSGMSPRLSNSTSSSSSCLQNGMSQMSFRSGSSVPSTSLSFISTQRSGSPQLNGARYQTTFSSSNSSTASAQVHTPGSSTTTTEHYNSSSLPTPTEYAANSEIGGAPGAQNQAFPSPVLRGSQPVATYKCTFEGCNAPPFQTQYLLNSHANVHTEERPYFCPEKNCPRSEGGRGFKRKNEMIRHGLVHDSPGYMCPFCPDREHRYPRPDNLQR